MLFDLTDRLASKGSVSMDKLIEEDAQGPNVNFVVVGGAKEHFRGHVLIGTAESGA